MTQVAILMGSASDRSEMDGCVEILRELGIAFRIDVASAHRSPAKVARILAESEKEGVGVFICVAGHAAHLAGVVAAHTTRPVVGVPTASSSLSGWDALLSTAMMPPGIPVATMALGSSGGRNAALFAAAVLALADSALAARLSSYRSKQTGKIEAIATERG